MTISYIEGINCEVDTFGAECIEVNRYYGKNNATKDVKVHHYIISFAPEDNITMREAMDFGKEYVEKFLPGHQAILAVHPDGHNGTGNVHVHIVINSVRKYEGKKERWQDKPCEYRQGCKHKSTGKFMHTAKRWVMRECILRGYNQVDLLARSDGNNYWVEKRGKEESLMAKAGRGQTRRDSKRRGLRPRESVRADGKYQYKYHIDGKPHFVYSWRLEPTDKLPKGKKPCLSLRELEKQVNTDLDILVNIVDGQMTVCELVDRYLKTKTRVRQSTRQGYVTVQGVLTKEPFGKKTIRSVKTSDAKMFLIKLQQEDGKSYSSIHTIRGVLRPAFQMAVDDDIIVKNPFGFQLAGVLVNDAVTREAITKDQMRKFLKFVHDDVVYCKYYEVVYILFHTGMRISEFCGLTLKDIDLEKRIVNIDHQLQRTSDMRYIIETTKTDAGTRKLPITEDVALMFQTIIEDRVPPKVEKVIDGYSGFLFYDENDMPLVAMHWQHRFNHMVGRYNDIYRVQMPNITPHVCRHTYCSNMAKSGMNPKTLQYLMGHSDISVTMNVYTHIGFDDAEEELKRMEEFRKAQAEIEKKNDTKAISQKMFMAI